MIAAAKTELNTEWSVIRPVLLKNGMLKLAYILVVWMIHSTDNQDGRSNILMDVVYNPNRSQMGSVLLSLAEWDGRHFLDAILQGYTNLKRCAFYPGFTLAVRSLLSILSAVPGLGGLLSSIPSGLTVIFVGCSLNFTLHLANNWLLYKWLRAKGFSREQASFAALTFGIGANSLFHIVLYSESLFMFLTLLGLYGLALTQNNPASLSLHRFCLLTVVLATSGFVRSIGTLSGAYLGYPLLLEFIYCVSKPEHRKRAWSIFGRILIVIGCFLTPTIVLFFRTRALFCHGATAQDPNYIAPGFCDSPTGFFYSYIQDKYWGVQLFDYIKNTHHMDRWTWAIVSFIVTTIWLKKAYQNAGLTGLLTIHIPEFLSNHNLKSERIEQMPDLVITTIQYVSYYAYAHLGSIERFWSATPAYYSFLIIVQQVFVRVATPRDKDHPSRWQSVKSLLKYIIPASLAVKQLFVLVWYAMRIHPI